jgi:hypothetical protein
VGDGEAEMRDRGLIHKSREADGLIGHEKTMAQLTKQIGGDGAGVLSPTQEIRRLEGRLSQASRGSRSRERAARACDG